MLNPSPCCRRAAPKYKSIVLGTANYSLPGIAAGNEAEVGTGSVWLSVVLGTESEQISVRKYGTGSGSDRVS